MATEETSPSALRLFFAAPPNPTHETAIGVDPGFVRGAAGILQSPGPAAIDWSADARSKIEQNRRTMVARGKALRCVLLSIMEPGRKKERPGEGAIGEFDRPPEPMLYDIRRARETFASWLGSARGMGIELRNARVLIERQQARGSFGVREDLLMLSHEYATAAIAAGVHEERVGFVNGTSKLSIATQVMLGCVPGHAVQHEVGPEKRASRKVNGIAMVQRWWAWSGQPPFQWTHKQECRDLADCIAIAAQAWNPRGTFKTPAPILAGVRAGDSDDWSFIERPWYQ